MSFRANPPAVDSSLEMVDGGAVACDTHHPSRTSVSRFSGGKKIQKEDRKIRSRTSRIDRQARHRCCAKKADGRDFPRDKQVQAGAHAPAISRQTRTPRFREAPARLSMFLDLLGSKFIPQRKRRPLRPCYRLLIPVLSSTTAPKNGIHESQSRE